MARVFYHFEFFLVCCFLGTSRSRTVLPPQNLTLDFINTHPRVSWDPPPDFVEGCMYSVKFLGKQQENYGKSNYAESPHIGEGIMMNTGFLNVSVQTVCDGFIKSQEVFVTNNDPELVTNLDCAIISLSLTRCSWKPTVDAPPDLSFFYYLSNANSPNSYPLPPLHECPSYINTSDVRTGCELKVDTNQSLNILFNGTVNRRVARNTYKILFVYVRPPPLNWTVNKTKDKFHISWTPPDFPQFTWDYMIKYSGCDQNSITQEEDGNSASLNRVSSCPYRIAMRANAEGKGETEWTAFKHFDADTEQNLMLLPIILIPLTLAVLAVLTLLCCVKNKKRIFPEIPQPRNYLIDILDNNNKIGVHDVYFPTKEEECHITLVIDPQLNKPQV